MGSPTDQLTRRKLPPSQPLRRINAKQISHVCAETMSFSPSWSGPSCGDAIRRTKTVRFSLLALHRPRNCPPPPRDGFLAGSIGWWKPVAGFGTDHLTEALGIAQGLCSVALPSLNDSEQPKIIAIVVVMMFASTLAVVLRLIARYLSTAKYGYDDLFIVIALVSNALG